MIALDTSALVAIIANESDAKIFNNAMVNADELLIGMATVLELRIVLAGRVGPERANASIEAILAGNVRRIDFDRDHLVAAIAAFDRFGKGRHPAALNFGDCMAYAVAKIADCPLLYKGDDFPRTDIRSALTV